MHNDDPNQDSFSVPDPVFDEPSSETPKKESDGSRPQSPMDMPDPFAPSEDAPPVPPSAQEEQAEQQPEQKEPEKKGVPQEGEAAKAFGKSVNLHEVAPGLKHVRVAIGWDAPHKVGEYDYDLDACVFLLNRNNEVRHDKDFIFYNNLRSTDGHVVHSGDDVDGKAPGDNEVIEVNLEQLTFDIEAIIFTVSIHNADERSQTFKDVASGFIRVINLDGNEEVVRFDLAHNNTEHAAIKFAELRRNDHGSWDFTALNEPHEKSLFGIASDFKVNVAEP